MTGRKNTPQDFLAKQNIYEEINKLKTIGRYSQKEIAQKTGISQGLLSQYFTGKKTPTDKNLEKLADFFGIFISDLDPRYNTRHIIHGNNLGMSGNNSGTLTINNTNQSEALQNKSLQSQTTDTNLLQAIDKTLKDQNAILTEILDTLKQQ